MAMIVHFVASVLNIKEDIADFRKVIKVIHSEGHVFTRDWVEPAYAIAKEKSNFEALNWSSIYSENIEALARADVVIVDTTFKSFSVGFQTAIALQQKKPTLLLSRRVEPDKLFNSGITDKLLTYKEVGENNLEQIVREFIQENTLENKDLRFNFFIDRQIYNYLKWASLRSSLTKAEILRQLVLKEINKDKEIIK